MQEIEFKCLKCGNCCKTKFLCLYPHELEKAFKFAAKKKIQLNIEPIRFRIDFKNKVILDLIYRVTKRPCPFFNHNQCTIHENRFVACRKYPFSNWTKSPDLFVKFLKFPEYFYDIDIKCSFIKKFYNNNEKIIQKKMFNDELDGLEKDIEIYGTIEKKLDELNSLNIIELKKETKFKHQYPEKYNKILNNWKHKSFFVY
ncbi:MAG: YkgJ family cysteine cluster protein [Candidatus Helarchaeota archaeon]